MAKASRRHGRENALQVLFQMDGNGAAWDPVSALDSFFANFDHVVSVREFASELVRGVAEHRAEIDGRIGQTATQWRLERMSSVDRNLLRLGAYELMYCSEVPTSVVINEAIEIARRYGAETSPGFVNGILDEIARQVRSP
ncbi:MAG: transcription antitermination factor NusB [Deltaproteobacteria bacterium]|nr:transcription antitermination factor NusB [Deltaproteobacteria bacterium]